MTSAPILLLTFKRLDAVQQVLNAIRIYQPRRLYISSDGHRDDKPGEEEKIKAVRKLILSQIDWPCDINVLFREKNLGCRIAVSTAIDWFFENETEGIILEEDCVPNTFFFQYTNELLAHYRNDNRIMSISGHNFHFDEHKKTSFPDSYFFSRYHHCWGWATWRRAWEYYDHEMNNWPLLKNSNWLLSVGDGNVLFKEYWTYIFDKAYNNKIDSWAYRWLFSCWTQHGLSVLPNTSLILNIGFDEEATHTKLNCDKIAYESKNVYGQESYSTILKHNEYLHRNFDIDQIIDKHWFRINWLLTIRRKLILR